MTPVEETLASLLKRERVCWEMAAVFLENRDAHGLMDIGAELQSLKLAVATVRRVGGLQEV